MSVTRNDLAESVYRKTPLTKRRAKELVDFALEIIKSTLASGVDVMIFGFGKFEVRDKGPRRGRNPQTGEAITLDARRIVTFKPSGKLREKLNRGPNGEEG